MDFQLKITPQPPLHEWLYLQRLRRLTDTLHPLSPGSLSVPGSLRHSLPAGEMTAQINPTPPQGWNGRVGAINVAQPPLTPHSLVVWNAKRRSSLCREVTWTPREILTSWPEGRESVNKTKGWKTSLIISHPEDVFFLRLNSLPHLYVRVSCPHVSFPSRVLQKHSSPLWWCPSMQRLQFVRFTLNGKEWNLVTFNHFHSNLSGPVF